MSAIGQLYYNLLVDEQNPTIMSTIPTDIFYNGNIVTFYGAQGFTKLSIQAPPGALARVNQASVLISSTGIYELDYDNIVVTSLSFVRPLGTEMVEKAIGYQFQHQAAIDQERGKDISNESLKEYNLGIHGIYVARSESPMKELYNVIIDFVYE